MKKRSQLTMAVAAILLGGMPQAYSSDSSSSSSSSSSSVVNYALANQLVVDTNKIGLATTDVLHQLAGNLNPDGTIINGSLQAIITAADAAVLAPPTADLLADIATVEAMLLPAIAIAAAPGVGPVDARTGVLSSDILLIKGKLGINGATIGNDIGDISEKVLVTPTGNLSNDLGTVDASLVVAPTGVLQTDVTTVKTRLGINGANLEQDEIDLGAKILAAPTAVLNADIGTLATNLVNAPSGVLQVDVNTVKTKLGVPILNLEASVDLLLTQLNASAIIVALPGGPFSSLQAAVTAIVVAYP